MFHQPVVNILDFFCIELKWNAHFPLFLDCVVPGIGMSEDWNLDKSKKSELSSIFSKITTDMLSRFFYCQWWDGSKLDWTTQVKSDLEGFNLPSDLEYIQKKSNFSWKNLVKKQAKGYELSKLIELKEGKNASKLANLS